MSEAIVPTPSTPFILPTRAWQSLSRLAASISDCLVGQPTLEQEAQSLFDLAAQYEARQPGFAHDLREAAERRLALGRCQT